MKPSLHLAAVLSLVLLAACQTVAPSTTKAYANADSSLAFDYPAGWVVVDDQGDRSPILVPEAQLVTADAAGFAADQGRLLLSVYASPPGSAVTDALLLVASFSAEAGNGATLEFMEEPAFKKLGDQEFVVAVMQSTSIAYPDQPVVYLMGARTGADATLFAFGETSPEGAAAFQPIFEAVLASLVMSRPTCADEPDGCY